MKSGAKESKASIAQKKNREKLYRSMRERYKRFTAAKNDAERATILLSASKKLQEYLKQVWDDRGQSRGLNYQETHLAAACVALGHMMNAESIYYFRYRFLAYWNPAWDKIAE